MKEYMIFTDVSCDIAEEFLLNNDFRFIPMEYTLDEEIRLCKGKESEEILKKFYDGQRGGDLTKTTQINPHNYLEIFTPIMKSGISVMYLSLSSGLSNTYQSALSAKKALKDSYPDCDLFVVDTLSATGGMGVLLERACRNRDNGMSIEENCNDVVSATKNIRHWFMVQDLNYLKRGGRISGATAVIGSMLNIKPILKINPCGKLETIEKKRGNASALNTLFEKFKSSFDECAQDSVYVIDADAKDLGDSLAQKIQSAYPSAIVRRSMLSPIIGAHTGPGMVAVCHIGKEL